MNPHPTSPIEQPATPAVDISSEAVAEFAASVRVAIRHNAHRREVADMIETLVADRDRLSAELRESFDAGVEQGLDEATAYEWGARSRQSRDDAFQEYLRDQERRTLAKLAEEA